MLYAAICVSHSVECAVFALCAKHTYSHFVNHCYTILQMLHKCYIHNKY